MPAPLSHTSFYVTDAQRWQAVLERDARADAHFVYAVHTTGIYCRPGAAKRLPRRENVRFFETAQAAEAAGFRASRTQGVDGAARSAIIAAACHTLDAADHAPALDTLAAQAGLSAFHFHRLFKAETGVTPKAYATAARARRLRAGLDTPEASVTEAIYGAGFQSSSSFYETADQRLGMPARDYRDGGAGAQIRFAVGQCSLGGILVAQSQRGICAILLGDDPELLLRDLQDRFPKAELLGADSGFEQLVAQVVGLIEAPALGLQLPLDVRGTAFQERVWQALREIPAGSTVSYAELAARIGSPRAVRAVGSACGANPLAVAIPCHRVLRSNGDLSGYRWGLERKRALLLREAQGQPPAPRDLPE